MTTLTVHNVLQNVSICSISVRRLHKSAHSVSNNVICVDHNGILWMSANGAAPLSSKASSSPYDTHITPTYVPGTSSYNVNHVSAIHSPFFENSTIPAQPADDFMQVEDTPQKIYIHNLDDDLAEVGDNSTLNSDSEQLVFLPDIERHLNKLSKRTLMGQLRSDDDIDNRTNGSAENALVLYSVLTSLTVPVERDNVRKAILESRARARERQVGGWAGEVRDVMLHDAVAVRGGEMVDADGPSQCGREIEEDVDAMDIG